MSHLEYDLLHLTPPMSAPAVLETGTDFASPESGGFISVNPDTLGHVKYPNIFALGDCSNIPTSKTAAAVSSESRVLCENLTDLIRGGSGEVAKYNGYTSCPLITGYRKGILAEFDYNLTPLETFPIDQSQERAFFAWLKRSVLPPLYWNGLIKESRTFDERLNDATKIKRKYPDRIPVIVEKHPGSQINDLDKHKFLVPNDITVAQFMWIIRRRLQLSAEKALFLFFDDFVPQSRRVYYSGQWVNFTTNAKVMMVFSTLITVERTRLALFNNLAHSPLFPCSISDEITSF
ncbi:hypothetical protein ACTXT7_014525 [Hymenolepis weldensis]